MPQTDVLFWERVTRLEPASVPTKATGFCGAPNLRFQVKVEVASSRDKKKWRYTQIGISPYYGASDEARTRYLHLGKVALYQMSYTRDNKRDDTRYHPFCQHKIQSFSKKLFLIPPRFPDRRGRGRWTRYSPDRSSAGRCTASGAGPGGGTGPTGGDSRGRWPQ